MRIDVSKQFNSCVKKYNRNKGKGCFELKVDNNNEKINLIKTSKRVIRYILEGGVIRVYLFENGNKRCIKTIPLAQATPDILALVENISFKDILMIKEMQKKGQAL